MRLVIALSLASSVAAADPGWDGGIVHVAGTFPIAHQSNFVLGTRLEAGGHCGPVALLAEYTFYDFESSAPGTLADRAHRVGATARVRFGGPDGDHHERYVWLELGAGEQLYGIAARQTRDDIAAGAGWQMSWRNIRDVQVGFFFALRATQAAAPDADAMAPRVPETTCRGTCPTTAPSAGTDRSVVVTAGVVFGS